MTDKPTGVFVRLPLSSESEDQFDAFYGMGGSLEMEIVNLGTPVMGGDIPVVTTLGTLRDPVPCVRQSDHLAALAAAQAEIVRLREGLSRIEKQANEYPGDDAAALGWIVSECDALKGPEA